MEATAYTHTKLIYPKIQYWHEGDLFELQTNLRVLHNGKYYLFLRRESCQISDRLDLLKQVNWAYENLIRRINEFDILKYTGYTLEANIDPNQEL